MVILLEEEGFQKELLKDQQCLKVALGTKKVHLKLHSEIVQLDLSILIIYLVNLNIEEVSEL